MKLKTPPYLKKGDRVALVAPAGFLTDEKPILLAEQLLQSWGLVAIRSDFLLEQDGYFAGTDAQRSQDFQKALDNPKIKAIWAVRGGYGSMRILSKLKYTKFVKNPKWIIGFSDITAFHSVLHNIGYKSIHGIMPIQLTKPVKETEKATESLYKALFKKDVESIIPASKYNRIGSTEAVVVGGNLSILQSLLGSPCQIKTKNKILFIEEIGEDMYRVDRLLQSLKAAGYFRDLKALIVGSFRDIKTDSIAGVKTYQELILEVVEEYEYPVLFDVPSGHIADNRALILGAEVLINVGEFVSCIRFKQG